jgi:hypothetical protein
MSTARLSREKKRQLGRYLTPPATAAQIVEQLEIKPAERILEPSFGEGSFMFAIIDSLASTLSPSNLREWCSSHLFGCEIDGSAYNTFVRHWESRDLGSVPANIEQCDFFRWLPPGCDRGAAINRTLYFRSRLEQFDLILGNPPFGGSIDPTIQDELDAILGFRNGKKIKKETYALFIVKSIDMLKPGGRLVFICSDTLLTIPTMTGLRHLIQSNCEVQVSKVPGTFADTNQKMLLLTLIKKARPSSSITVYDKRIPIVEIEATPNMSWQVDSSFARYFTGATVGDKMIATSGMTIGNNELFLRRIILGEIEEPYDFTYFDQTITVDRELAHARLGKISPSRLKELRTLEARGETEKAVKWEIRNTPKIVRLPDDDYCYYNKASSKLIYASPEWAIFWRDFGNYVYTFKKTGNWYLHGVGGKKHFQKEGLTWSLIAPRLYARYLPAGYIFDSGSPCAFLREGIPGDELFFIIGWALTDLCNDILKRVLNHTRNIQSKDFERLPYPVWVSEKNKSDAIRAVKVLVSKAQAGETFTFKDGALRELNRFYEWNDQKKLTIARKSIPSVQPALL